MAELNFTTTMMSLAFSEPITESVSPVTLSTEWPRLARLLLLASMAVIGSVGNVFMISAVMIEDHLKKTGNAFIVNVALSDLLITGLLIPASSVVLLAGTHDSHGVCRFQWFLAVTSFLVTILTLAITATENYIRLCSSQETVSAVTPARTTFVLIAIWLMCCITSGLQFMFENSFDYCNRSSNRLIPFETTICVGLVLFVALVTFACFLRITYKVRFAKSRPNFKPSITFNWDYSLMKTNLYSFLLFVVFWMPFGIVLVVGSTRVIPNRIFYNLAWFALSKSCVNNFLYCLTNRHFRNAYVNLFHYCCCKTTVSFSRRQRGEGTRPSGDVRVHIIPGYNMYSYTSPQRGREAPAKRGSGGRQACSRPNGRDVYEL